MKALVMLTTIALAACASTQSFTSHQPESALQPASEAAAPALLLVSLADGQLVLQEIEIDADVCMKSNAAPATRCFKRGAPIYAADSSTIVAYEAVTRELDLHAAQ